MKHIFTFRISVWLIAWATWAGGSLNAQNIVADSAIMGPGYANDVYYSFATGTVASPQAGNYDIAFYTTIWSAGIMTNDGRGVSLWAYPAADTNGWATLDTTGLSTWTPLYNSIESWEEGAFNRNSKGHPDYGWGVYNTITHDVTGDSLFVIKTRNGMYKKLWIVAKHSSLNTYAFRYADLDGSNEQSAELNCTPYITKNFVAYDIENNQMVDREPDKNTWDLLFTKYMGLYGGTTPYPVTGVLNNLGSVANRFYPVSPDYTDWGATPFSSNREVIGWDWKTFDMGTFSYIVEDSIVYFDSTLAGNIQKLQFTGFTGSATGKVYFNRQIISGAGIQPAERVSMKVWPNPATSVINFTTPSAGQLTLSDLSGRILLNRTMEAGDHLLQTAGFAPGLYLLTFSNGSRTMASRLVIQ